MTTRGSFIAKFSDDTGAPAVTNPPAVALIRIGVVGAGQDWAEGLRDCLPTRPRFDLIAVPSLSGSIARSANRQWDVVLAFLSSTSMHALSEVLTLHDRLGHPEIVTVSEHDDDAAALALREFGVDRVLSQRTVGAWLGKYLAPLASMALAKRLLREARAAIPEGARPERGRDEAIVPLSVAEGRFREAYLRALMARAGTRTEAAERARIPYRTLCYMLGRLDIR